MKKMLLFSLLLLAACSSQTGNPFLDDPSFCNVDGDCTCGGMYEGDCFVGNVLFASANVDMSKDCPDFCSGIAGDLETMCVDHECSVVKKEIIACTEDAKLCPDGSAVGRVPPDCDFAPCPGEECSVDSDCVPASCCHATSCVPKSQAPNCDAVACTMNCEPGTLDCGGSCVCQESKCSAVISAS